MASFAEGTTARGILRWPAPAVEDSQIPGDWYLTADGASPLAGAFLGQPVDSFPPAIQLTPLDVGSSDWVALSAQLGRRGAARPAIVGGQDGRTRHVVVGVQGLWRWAFRGGSSEESYRSLVAVTASWLLGGADSARGVARVARPVVENGRPIVFEWVGSGSPGSHSNQLVGRECPGQRYAPVRRIRPRDGVARSWVVSLPSRRMVGPERSRSNSTRRSSCRIGSRSRRANRGRPCHPGRRSARDWLPLFALCVLALAGEWLARRRLGLR